jgi:hypothetical protein
MIALPSCPSWLSLRKGCLSGCNWLFCAGFAALMVLCVPAAMAQTNLVQNGSFAITGGTKSFQFGTYRGTTAWNGTFKGESMANWASTSYGFVFNSTDAIADGTYGTLSLYNINSIFSTHGSVNFIAVDASPPYVQPVTQTINGLVVGALYTLKFDWAGAQQTNFSGATTEEWKVSLGGTTQNTPLVNNASQSWTGWMTQTMHFRATSTTEVLSFLAFTTTTSCNLPPFALLANVSLVPEPAGVASMFVGVVALLGLSWRRSIATRGIGGTA